VIVLEPRADDVCRVPPAGAVEHAFVRGVTSLPLGDLAPRSRRSGRGARHDMRCSGRQQYDVARKLFDGRLSCDAHPTHAGGHGVQRRLRGPRKAHAPPSSGAQVRHHGATHAQQVEDVVERATDLHPAQITCNAHSVNA
jgi:hypothetical protein